MSKLFVDEMQGNTSTTISIPSGQTLNVAGNLSSTAGSISGTPSFPDGAKVNTIKHTGGTTGLTINSNGYINKPNQPCFSARRTNTAGTTQGFSGNIIFDSKTLDLGNNYTTSNGRFTAPVAGTYYFSHAGLGASGSSASTHNSGASWHLEFLLNGTRTGFQFYWYQGNPTAGGTQPQYINSYMDMVITLNANDYITVQLPDGTDSYYSDSSTYYDTYFQGSLIA